MAKTGNPFLDGDFAELFDVNRFFEQFDVARLTEQFKFPTADGKRLIEAQQRNMEAITRANRIAMEGAQAMLRRQGEIFSDSLAEGGRAMHRLAAASTPEERMSVQTEIVKEAYERGLANLRELSELNSKSNEEATEVLNKRISEALEEMKDFLKSA